MFLNSEILVIKLLDSRKVSIFRCVSIVEKCLITFLSICHLVLIKIPEETFFRDFYFHLNFTFGRPVGMLEHKCMPM
jgi:hypothetical protein